MTLMQRVMKESKNPYICKIMESEILSRENLVPIDLPALNIALSGDLDGGIGAGVTTIAGKSKHFKSLFVLEIARSFLESNPEAEVAFFDSEFGTPPSYFEKFGDMRDRVYHIPVKTVEDLRFQMTQLIDMKEKTDNKILIMLDSIGGLASKKEVEDALKNKSSVDMTRAKHIKSFFRIVTPEIKIKDIPLVVINHTYQTLERFSQEVMSGGTGNVYHSDNILFIGKQQEKDGKELVGFNFIINIEKSRFVKEKMKIPVLVTWEEGIHKYSHIFDLAVEAGIIGNPSKGYYAYPDLDKKQRRKVIETDENMEEILANEDFKDFVRIKYQITVDV